jgi:excisionase family DNA binding protein
MTTPRSDQIAYSQADAAALLGVSVSTVRRMIKAQQLRAVQLGQRRSVVTRDDLERLLAPAAASDPRR